MIYWYAIHSRTGFRSRVVEASGDRATQSRVFRHVARNNVPTDRRLIDPSASSTLPEARLHL